MFYVIGGRKCQLLLDTVLIRNNLAMESQEIVVRRQNLEKVLFCNIEFGYTACVHMYSRGLNSGTTRVAQVVSDVWYVRFM